MKGPRECANGDTSRSIGVCKKPVCPSARPFADCAVPHTVAKADLVENTWGPPLSVRIGPGVLPGAPELPENVPGTVTAKVLLQLSRVRLVLRTRAEHDSPFADPTIILSSAFFRYPRTNQ